MTFSLFRMYRALPREQRSPLPPAKLTHEVTKAAGADRLLSRPQESFVTMVSHFGYGAAMGMIYASISSKWDKPAIVKGTVFGFGVWTASYLGWIPLFGLRTSAPRMSLQRNLMMIAAHVLWGASLGYAEKELKKRGLQMLAQPRPAKNFD
jgi:putative membrane protein